MNYRIEKLISALEKENIDALLIKKSANQRYLEGFTGSGCFLVASARGNFLFADSRYVELAAKECRTAEVRPYRAPHMPVSEAIAALVTECGFSSLGFEKNVLTWGEYEGIARFLGKTNAKLIPTSGVIERIRSVKDAEEIESIKIACNIADIALQELIPIIRPGISELDIRNELDYRMKKAGAEDLSFDTMVLFGASASQPHANSRGDIHLAHGNFILIDYGAVKDGYHSDTTRTFVLGKASPEQRRAFNAVLKAETAGIALALPGANGRTLNERSVSAIESAGFPAFEHGIGHGVGLEIHELPTMRQKMDVTIEPGNVITVEPGMYKPGWGGIRIEDTVLITEGGNEVLTRFPKELFEL